MFSFAPIVPQKFLPLIVDREYHMCLAHLLGTPGYEEYTRIYTAIGQSDKFLIMDNGVIEGDPRPIEELIVKAAAVNAAELILPDVFRDKEATLKDTRNAIDFIRGGDASHLVGDFEVGLMAVPQGDSYEEWLECAIQMIEMDIDTIGIPKVLCHLDGQFARIRAIIDIQHACNIKGIRIHLLGCWDTPIEYKIVAHKIKSGEILPFVVRGTDSAIPYAFARAGMKFSHGPRPEGPINFLDTTCDPILLMDNVVCTERACQGPTEDAGKIYTLE